MVELSFYKTNLKLSRCLITTFKLPSNKQIRIFTIYRLPSSQYICFLDYFHQLVSTIPIENKIIVGDFNFHISKPDKPTNSFINSLIIFHLFSILPNLHIF